MTDETNETNDVRTRGEVWLLGEDGDNLAPVMEDMATEDDPLAIRIRTFDSIDAARAWLRSDDCDVPAGTYRPVRVYGALRVDVETVTRRTVSEA